MRETGGERESGRAKGRAEGARGELSTEMQQEGGMIRVKRAREGS